MEKVYRKSWLALLKSLLSLILGVIVIFVISGTIFNYKVATFVSIILGVLFTIFIFRSSKIEVIITERKLHINLGTREYQYDIDKVSFHSEQVNNDCLTLYVVDENGKKQDFDLSLLGTTKYYEILEYLGIIGDKSEIIKLN